MRFERIKTFSRSLRFRLTVWNTAVVFAFLLANIVAIRQGLEANRSEMVDAFIEEELHTAVLDLDRLGAQPDQLHEQLNRQALGHPRRRLFVQLLDGQGALVWSSEQSPPPDALAGVLAAEEPETVADHRVRTQTVNLPGRPALDCARWLLLGPGLLGIGSLHAAPCWPWGWSCC